MPPYRKPRSLKTLCIEFIVDDIRHHRKRIGVISQLPTYLLNTIHEYILDHTDVQEQTCVERLGCTLSLFNLSHLRWVGRSPPRDLQLLSVSVRLLERCHCLTHIALSLTRLTSSEWKRLLCAINRVRKLQVNGTDITDECLKVLGERCPDLEDLNLSDCTQVTNSGVENLVHCKTDGSWTCLELTTLDVFGTKVDPVGARYLLLHARALSYLHFQNLCHVIHNLALRTWHPQPPLRLRLASLVLHQDREFSPDQALHCIRACPHLTELVLFSEGSEDNSDHDYMKILPGLQKLSVFAQEDDNISFHGTLLLALPLMASTLTTLQLTEVQGLSLTFIGRNCPRLTKLEIGMRSRSLSKDHRPRPGEILFPNLRQLFVFRREPCQFDAESLGVLLFSCHKLESLLLCCLKCLNDEFVKEWVAHNPLNHLEYFEIVLDHRLTTTGLWELMQHCDNLKNLVVPPSDTLARHAILRLNRKAREQIWDIKISEDESDIGLLLESL